MGVLTLTSEIHTIANGIRACRWVNEQADCPSQMESAVDEVAAYNVEPNSEDSFGIRHWFFTVR